MVDKIVTEGCRGDKRQDNIIPDLRLCKCCKREKDKSEFASKGKVRVGLVCKECDNKRRRTKYKPSGAVQGRSQIKWQSLVVHVERNIGCHETVAPLLWQTLLDHGFVESLRSEIKTESADSLLGRKNPINGIIGVS